ncbi:Sulfate Permease (SulP) Family [Trachipleistophora hominis]|uniref:Sulfate Permease (SulP) Family n=1 Tax=Trachipleistophora hominis TaxID=72359 RepID=L7JRR0_TRAHO|nr:Sulfate Permease (SulP) Family [Trachipleistophora hominis]
MNPKRTFSISALISTSLMAIIFQLMDMLSYGRAMFKSDDPEQNIIVQNIGMLCYIYSTIWSQLLFNYFSKIDAAIISSVIVESLPFMEENVGKIINKHTSGLNGYITNFIAILLICSVGFGIVSLLLKYGRAGHLISLIPKAVVNGCLGAIGLTQFPLGWSALVPKGYEKKYWLLCTIAIAVAVILFILQFKLAGADFLIPLYTLIIITLFYGIAFIFVGASDRMQYLRDNNWLPIKEAKILYPNYVLSRIDLSTLNWRSFVYNFFNILTVIFFNSVHIAVNLPAYKISTGVNFDFSDELGTQGFSNLFTFIPCYFVACYSIAFYKAGGTLKIYGYVSALAMILIAVFGLTIKGYVPNFVLSMLPFVMGAGFLYSSFYEPIFTTSIYEYSISVVVCLICWLTGQYIVGVLVGLGICVAYYIIASRRKIALYDSLDVIESDNIKVIVVDYLLCFLTAKRFVLPEYTDILIMDFSRCQGVDWLGMDLIVSCCEKARKVYFIGSPINLRVKRLKDVQNLVLVKDYSCLYFQMSEDV